MPKKEIKDPHISPLRYPGGKAILNSFFKNVLLENEINGIYCEAYAGGAGAALELLISNRVNRIILNDADYHIYCFWISILNHTEEFIRFISRDRVSMTGWRKQRKIYENPQDYSMFEVGYSTFFLNRCNRGGILPHAGPIGGFEQTGNYSIRARFNKRNLITRIENIGARRKSIEIHNLDAMNFLRNIVSELDPFQTLIYLDPPYYEQGQNLYLNFYSESDHKLIGEFLNEFQHYKWIISYDNVKEIKKIYDNYRKFSYDLNYSCHVTRKGKELLVFSDNLFLPEEFVMRSVTQRLICA